MTSEKLTKAEIKELLDNLASCSTFMKLYFIDDYSKDKLGYWRYECQMNIMTPRLTMLFRKWLGSYDGK